MKYKIKTWIVLLEKDNKSNVNLRHNLYITNLIKKNWSSKLLNLWKINYWFFDKYSNCKEDGRHIKRLLNLSVGKVSFMIMLFVPVVPVFR